MRQTNFFGLPLSVLFVITLTGSMASQAQNPGIIDFKKDTIAKAKVNEDRQTYVNNLKGNSKKATERISLPVDKLKAIMDACSDNGISDISVMIITVGESTVDHFKYFNPGATMDEIKGSQMLVFKVPRRAFASALGAKINLTNNPLMLSLLGAGLVLLDSQSSGLPAGEDLYFSFGGICPPPASCD